MSTAHSQRAAAPGRVALPWNVTDTNGNQWMIYQQGFLRQQGNMPLFAQAAMLSVNGNNPAANVNQASVDPRTGELVLEGMNVRNGVTVTRRVMVNRQESWVRFIDVFRNTSAQEQVVAVQYASSFNYQPTAVQLVDDPRSKDHQVGVALALEVGRAIYEVYAGKGAKLVPQINSQPNNNQVTATAQVSIPPNKQVALVHVHGIANGPEPANQTVLAIRESRLLADVAPELRKTIANVAAAASVGDREVLRGDLLDIIELRDGDQLKGTLAENSYKLQAFYGAMELPADRVVGLVNVGQFRPKQLLVTVDGEVFGGTLGKDSIGIQLSSGQTVQVPLGQISRVGYRKRVGEAEEWTFDKPLVLLRSGERLFTSMPSNSIDVMTRFGPLKLPPATVASVQFQSDEHAVHQIRLNDGSEFAALVMSDSFDLQLAGTTTQRVNIPAAMIEQIRLTGKDVERDESAAFLQLISGDVFVGTLAGQQQLDTRFDTIALSGPEVRTITHDPDAGMDVQVVLWDQTTVGGQLREPLLKYELASGITIQVPLALIKSYSNPSPRPTEGMVQRIKSLVQQLSADDWKQREQAEAQLAALGPNIVAVLKEMSGKVPPEAQQRIDSILIQLQSNAESSTPPSVPVPGRGR